MRENGADTFTITGWGDTPEDEIYLWFLPDRYGTGSVLEREDFAAQTAAGASGLCHLSFYGDMLGGSTGNCDISAVDDVTVTVLERSVSVCAISYTCWKGSAPPNSPAEAPSPIRSRTAAAAPPTASP